MQMFRFQQWIIGSLCVKGVTCGNESTSAAPLGFIDLNTVVQLFVLVFHQKSLLLWLILKLS